MTAADPLAEAIVDALRGHSARITNGAAWEYDFCGQTAARAAREHIAAEITSFANCTQPPLNAVHAAYWSGVDAAARVARRTP